MDDGEFRGFYTDYYRTGTPEKALEALKHFLTRDRPSGLKPRFLPIEKYFFARIAEGRSEILRGYESALLNASAGGRPFVLSVLGWAGDGQTEAFLKSLVDVPPYSGEPSAIKQALAGIAAKERIDPLRQEIVGAEQLDLLWAEFFATGNRQAVWRIIQVLQWKDLVRERLEGWLRAQPHFHFWGAIDWMRKDRLKRLQNAVGIDCTYDCRRIDTVEDLDTFCTLEGLDRSPFRIQTARAALPFPLTGEDVRHLGTKMAAKWSLGYNAKEHPLVLETCEEAILQMDGTTKLALLEIAADARLNQRDYPNAVMWFRQYLQLNTAKRGFRRKRLLAESEIELDRLMAITKDSMVRESVVDEPRKAVFRCVRKMHEASSFYSRAIMRDPRGEISKNPFECVWRIAFEAPDRIHVNQATSAHEYDEWITIGEENFLNPGLWCHIGHSPMGDLNVLLRGTRWLEFLRTTKPEGAVYRHGEEQYLVLEYAAERIGHLLQSLRIPDIPAKVEIWIDVSTDHLISAQLIAQGHLPTGDEIHLDCRQVFTAFGAEIRIEAPELQLVSQRALGGVEDERTIEEQIWKQHTDHGLKALEQGDYVEAEGWFKSALKEAETFGPGDPRLVTCLNNLAELHRAKAIHARHSFVSKVDKAYDRRWR